MSKPVATDASVAVPPAAGESAASVLNFTTVDRTGAVEPNEFTETVNGLEVNGPGSKIGAAFTLPAETPWGPLERRLRDAGKHREGGAVTVCIDSKVADGTRNVFFYLTGKRTRSASEG